MSTLRELEALHPGLEDYSCEAFIGNECGSDEYRECQPQKGLMFIADLWSFFEAGGHEEEERDAFLFLKAWIDKMADARFTNPENYEPWERSYAGAKELEPLMVILHKHYWANDIHPYERDYVDDDFIQEFLDDQKGA